MLISFVIIQFAPGGPVERIIAQLTGRDSSIATRIGGGGNDALSSGSQSQLGQGAADVVTSKYRGAQGLDPEFIKSLEKQFGFDKPAYERFFIMMKSYLTFDFGKSYFRDTSVLELIKEKLPVSISLGLWMMLLSYLISIPLGIRKAVHDGEPFDSWTSSVLVIAYAVPGFLFAVLLLILFAGSSLLPVVSIARPDVRQLGSALAVRQGRRLLLAPDAAADRHVADGVHDHDVPHQELVHRRDPQAVRDDGAGQGAQPEPGALRARVPQCHAADHRRLPGGVHLGVLRRRHADRDHFLARRSRPVVVRIHRKTRLSGGVRHAVDLLADGARRSTSSPTSPTPSSIRASTSRAGRSEPLVDLRALETPLPQSQPPPAEEHREQAPGWLARRMPSGDKLSPINQRRLANFKANKRGYWSLRIFLALFLVTLVRRVYRQ